MTYQIKGLPRRYIPVLNDGQFQAIADSRAKWQYLAWHINPWYEPNCVCCEYDSDAGGYSGLMKVDCHHCPIYGFTDAVQCRGTPYSSWSRIVDSETFDLSAEAQDQAEAEYLWIEGVYSIELHRRMGL